MHKIIKSPWHDSLTFSSLCVHWKTIGNYKTDFMIKSNYYTYYDILKKSYALYIKHGIQCSVWTYTLELHSHLPYVYPPP